MAALADLASHELLLGERLPLGAGGSGPERGEPAGCGRGTQGNLPQVGRQHGPAPPGVDYGRLACVTAAGDAAIYTRPEIGNNILIGSEDPPCDEHRWVDPDDYDRNFSDQWTVQVQRLAQRFPGLGISSRLQGCVDLYDVTEDWIPLYDRSCVDGFYMACGTSGNQFKNAPVAGKAMAALIEYCEAGNDHDARPMRYRLEHLDHEIDMATFSRLREVNQDSTFSVLG